jgi:hypothetical protein
MLVLHYDYGGNANPVLACVLSIEAKVVHCNKREDDFAYYEIDTVERGKLYATLIYPPKHAPEKYKRDIGLFYPDLVAICPNNF